MRRVWLLGLLGMACITARFDQFDGSFDPAPAKKEPVWLEGGLLPSEYLMVGVIYVRHGATTPRQTIIDRARKEARALGCELVMPAPPPELEEGSAVPEPGRTRFLCALPRPGARVSSARGE